MRNTAKNVIIIAVIAALVLGIGAGCLLTNRARQAAVADNTPDPGAQPPAANPPAGEPGNGVATPPSTQPPPAGAIGNNGGDKDSVIWIDVDVTKQRVYIMRGSAVEREMVASTGMKGKETPLGEFKIQNRGDWFFSDKYQEGAKWWASFKDWGVYLFHSLPMDKERNIIPEEAALLGQPASHGCVRLTVEDAKWIYDNMKQGTKVVIHE